jgi:regulatory protein
MSVITKLKAQAKNKERVNLHLDDKFFCGLQTTTVIKGGLRVGLEISKERLEQIQLESEKEVAANKALNLVSKNMKTKKQLKEYLLKKGYTHLIIDYVVKKLEEYNYIDDGNYAKLYVRQNLKNKGARRLKMELYNKGVSDKIINETLEELPEQNDYIEVLATKYMKNKEKTKENYSKLYAYLTRRGFSYDQIQPFLKGAGE